MQPGVDPVQVAEAVDRAAQQAAEAGRPSDAIAALREGVRVLTGLSPVPSVVGWLEYSLAEALFRAPGDVEDNRDRCIETLQRAVTRGIEVAPILYQKAWGSLGDRYATRTRGHRAENRRAALDAYESALRMTPPVAPEDEWARNSLHHAMTLLEDEADDPAVAAEGLAASWQAAQAAHHAGAEALTSEAVAIVHAALTELVRRVRVLEAPTPYEVALPTGSDDAWARTQAVVAVVMTYARSLLADVQVIQTGVTWQEVAAKAAETGSESLRGVARHHMGTLLLQLRHPDPGDHEAARSELEAAALLIDPAVHPWAWGRNEQELERLWRDRQAPGAGASPPVEP